MRWIQWKEWFCLVLFVVFAVAWFLVKSCWPLVRCWHLMCKQLSKLFNLWCRTFFQFEQLSTQNMQATLLHSRPNVSSNHNTEWFRKHIPSHTKACAHKHRRTQIYAHARMRTNSLAPIESLMLSLNTDWTWVMISGQCFTVVQCTRFRVLLWSIPIHQVLLHCWVCSWFHRVYWSWPVHYQCCSCNLII